MSFLVYVTTDGTIGTVPFRPDNSLKQLQGLVDGYIECVSLVLPEFGRVDVWVNEDGKGLELPWNPLTPLVQDQLFPGDYLAGDVAISKGVDDDGNTLGFDAFEVTGLETILLDAI